MGNKKSGESAHELPAELVEAKRQAQIERIEGMLKVLNQWDQASEIVAASSDRAEAIARLGAAPFNLPDRVAEGVVSLRLSDRTKLGRERLEEELHVLRTDAPRVLTKGVAKRTRVFEPAAAEQATKKKSTNKK